MFNIIILDSCKFFIAILSLIPILYWYLTRNNNYWSKQGIRGPKPVVLFGTFLDRLKDTLGIIDVQYMKDYGNVYGLFDGTSPVLQIADPELIKQVVVKEFNLFKNRRELRTEHPIFNKMLFFARSDDWKRMRIISNTTFTSAKIKKMTTIVKRCVQEYLDHLEEICQSQQNLDVKEININLAMDVIVSCAFSTKTNAMKDPNNLFLRNMKRFLDLKIARVIPAFIFPKFVNKMINLKSHIDPEACEWFITFIKLLIEKRKQSEDKFNDFLQLLIDAKEEDSQTGDETYGLQSHYFNKEEKDIISEKKHFADKSLTEEEVIAQSWVFLLAGTETTSSTMSYITREMALNPECQQKLYNEVKAAMGSEKEISYEDLHRLPYLDACISETLRLYPPVIRLEREANQDLILGESKIKIKKGYLVEIPVYAIHHSEKYFKNAEQFIPERFLPENRHQIIPYTYMPFGAGPRICIGMRFALLEIKLAMAHIIMRYRFTKGEKFEDKLKYQIFAPVLNAKSITVGIEKR